LFDRSDGIRPFLLLDGHHSRFEIPFLDYIHNKDHEWVCCIGVPYGTHIWQVADSPQMNGAFKINLTIAKRRLFQLKTGIRKTNFEMTDIIPLVRKAWEESFVNISGAKNAICERGWGPLNFALLDHPSLSAKNTATTNRPCTDINTLNISSGMAADMFDKLIEDKSKDEARVATLKKRKSYFDKLASEAEKLKSLTRISSGQLAGVAKYNVCSHTRDAIKHNLEKNEKKQMEQETKRRKRERDFAQRYISAKEKAIVDDTALTIDDMKSLLRFHRFKDDSPIRIKVKEIKEQWQRRRQRLFFLSRPGDGTGIAAQNASQQCVQASSHLDTFSQLALHGEHQHSVLIACKSTCNSNNGEQVFEDENDIAEVLCEFAGEHRDKDPPGTLTTSTISASKNTEANTYYSM
jgi:hypothetical protein